MLKFLGIGSAFNTQLGNTSAYIRENNSMLLIDCGGATFSVIQRNNILDGIEVLDVLITHTHPDHIGSLGDLIFYAYYIMKIKVRIHFPDKPLLQSILDSFGVDRGIYEYDDEMQFTLLDRGFAHYKIAFNPTKHIETLPAYGFYLTHGDITLYYSGDTYELDPTALKKLLDGEIQLMYHDTSGLDHDNNIHYPFSRLKAAVPAEHRSKVYCMHFDKHADYEDIRNSGFLAVTRSHE